MNQAAPNTRITIRSGTRWLSEYLKEGKAANKVEKAEAKAEKAAERAANKAKKAKAAAAKAAEKAEKAKAFTAEVDDLRQTNGMVSGDCPKCGKAYLDLRIHKLCRGRLTTVPARFQD